MKTYNQFCGVARALDIVGERWTLLLVRDLLLGPRRYSSLLAGLPGLTTNLLAKRLKLLLSHGLVQKTDDGAYTLTPSGRELESVVLALGRFGAQTLSAPHPGELTSMRWAMVSLKRRYQRSRYARTLVLHIGADTFTVRTGGEQLEIRDGHHAMAPDTTLTGTPQAWQALLMGGQTLQTLLGSGTLVLDGSAETAADFVAAVGVSGPAR